MGRFFINKDQYNSTMFIFVMVLQKSFLPTITMLYKFALIIIIVFFLTLLLGIKLSRKQLWAANNNSRNIKIFTFRSIVMIVAIVLFLVFSLLR